MITEFRYSLVAKGSEMVLHCPQTAHSHFLLHHFGILLARNHNLSSRISGKLTHLFKFREAFRIGFFFSHILHIEIFSIAGHLVYYVTVFACLL